MGHVNNAVYVDWAEEALRTADGSGGGASALDAVPRRWELEYARAAAPGDRAVATAWSDGSDRHCRIETADTGERILGARFGTLQRT